MMRLRCTRYPRGGTDDLMGPRLECGQWADQCWDSSELEYSNAKTELENDRVQRG